jgi:tRNA/rRNA methyltransferase
MSIASNLYVVLVEPQYRGNVGAVARVMNNFGFLNLRLVGAIPEREDHVIAVHSEDILDNIEVFDSLEEALQDIDLTIAFSRRHGRKKTVDLTTDSLGEFVFNQPRGRTGLVFGRETYGLKDEEAEQCAVRCTIPTSGKLGSLNLAQAVAIAVYELAKIDREKAVTLTGRYASITQIKEMTTLIVANLTDIGYFQDGDKVKVRKSLESIFAKSYTSDKDLYFLKKMFERIGFLFAKKDHMIN